MHCLQIDTLIYAHVSCINLLLFWLMYSPWMFPNHFSLKFASRHPHLLNYYSIAVSTYWCPVHSSDCNCSVMMKWTISSAFDLKFKIFSMKLMQMNNPKTISEKYKRHHINKLTNLFLKNCIINGNYQLMCPQLIDSRYTCRWSVVGCIKFRGNDKYFF